MSGSSNISILNAAIYRHLVGSGNKHAAKAFKSDVNVDETVTCGSITEMFQLYSTKRPAPKAALSQPANKKSKVESSSSSSSSSSSASSSFEDRKSVAVNALKTAAVQPVKNIAKVVAKKAAPPPSSSDSDSIDSNSFSSSSSSSSSSSNDKNKKVPPFAEVVAGMQATAPPSFSSSHSSSTDSSNNSTRISTDVSFELRELKGIKEPVNASASGKVKTWLALKDAKMSPDGLFLVFPEPIQCLRGGNVILTSILVSEDRLRVYDIILSSLCRNNSKILVTGTPGIGKSHFLYYVMWKLTQHKDFVNKRVFFQYDKDLLYELLENGARMSSVNEIELSSNSLLFVDNVSRSELIPCNAQTIAFSSPDTVRYREFRKNDDFIELILNPPSVDDIKCIFDRKMVDFSLFKDSNLFMSKIDTSSSVNMKEVMENVNIIGCIPRFVFKSTAKCKEFINSACKQKYYEMRRKFSVSGAFSSFDEDYYFGFIHLVSRDNLTRSFKFSSQYVILFLLSIQNGLEITDVLNRLANEPSTTGNGYLFENICHSMFSLKVDGQKVTTDLEAYCSFTQDCRPLFKKQTKSNVLNSFSMDLDEDGERRIDSRLFVFEFKEEVTGTNKEFRKNTYYHAAANFESINAFTIIDDDVYFFQFTNGSKHDISGFGLYDVIKSISASYGLELKFHLIFVGIDMSGSFKNFSSQKIIKTKKIQAKNAIKYANDANIIPSKPILGIPLDEEVQLSLKPHALPNISQHILGLNVDRTILKWGLNTDSNLKAP